MQNHSPGQCSISCEVAGDSDDRMPARRAALFKPLSIAIAEGVAESLDLIYGTAPSLSSLSSPPAPREVIEPS